MKRIIILFIAAFLMVVHCSGQNEFFGTLDPTNSSFKKVSSFPEINWIYPFMNAYSQAHHQYYFYGAVDKDWSLYTVDAYTGNIVNASPVPKSDSALSVVTGSVYNENDNKIYALYMNTSSRLISLIAIDPAGLGYRVVCDLPAVAARGTYASIDQAANTYICAVYDSLQWYYVIDLSTGGVVAAQTAPFLIFNPVYDNSKRLIYGIAINMDSVQRTLVGFDPFTCGYTAVRRMDDMHGNYGPGGFFTYDQVTKNYYCAVIDANDKPAIAIVNTNTGALQDVPASFPHVDSRGDNIACWQYDTSLSKIFALHWEPAVKQPKTRVYPNPFRNMTTVYLDTVYNTVTTVLFTADGKRVQSDDATQQGKIHIKRNGLPSGEYYLKVYGNGALLGVQKVVAE